MNQCPITYEECGSRRYSISGLRLLNLKTHNDLIFPYTASEQLEFAAEFSDKLSVAGVQPKLSVRLNISKASFKPVEKGGTFIIKPPHILYPELPANEDLTMKLADKVGIEVPLHGLVYGSDNSLSYFIKRFDRYGRNKKHGVEDFSSLLGQNRESKYEGSMEKLVPIIEKYCSYPHLEKIKLFRLTLFCFLIGNEDMHLKNFSLITRNGKTELSPAYDLVNSGIVVRGSEELALALRGKKNKFKRNDFIEYYGKERLGLSENIIMQILQRFVETKMIWKELLDKNFLSMTMRERYLKLVTQRWNRIWTEGI